MARAVMPTLESMRWENDENTRLLSEQPNVQRRIGALSRPLPRMPLKEITHLFPTDAPSLRKRNSIRNRGGAHASNRKRRVSQANALKADRQSALLRKLR